MLDNVINLDQLRIFISNICVGTFLKSDDISENVNSVLDRIVMNCSDNTLVDMLSVFPQGSYEYNYLKSKYERIKSRNRINFSQAIEDDLFRFESYAGDFLDSSYVEDNFFCVLTGFIEKCGYRKVSDFYNEADIDRRKWSDYKKGEIPSKNLLFRMIFFLRLDFFEAEHLLNVAGMTFCRNQMTDMIVLFFLRHDYPKNMLPEQALYLLDETLENFGCEPIYSIK